MNDNINNSNILSSDSTNTTSITGNTLYFKSNPIDWCISDTASISYDMVRSNYLEVDDIVQFFLYLPEEQIQSLFETWEKVLIGSDHAYFKQFVSKIVRKRHFSEDFLISIMEHLEDKKDLLAVHKYDIATGKYMVLLTHLQALNIL